MGGTGECSEPRHLQPSPARPGRGPGAPTCAMSLASVLLCTAPDRIFTETMYNHNGDQRVRFLQGLALGFTHTVFF